jgi:hypothetical protein
MNWKLTDHDGIRQIVSSFCKLYPTLRVVDGAVDVTGQIVEHRLSEMLSIVRRLHPIEDDEERLNYLYDVVHNSVYPLINSRIINDMLVVADKRNNFIDDRTYDTVDLYVKPNACVGVLWFKLNTGLDPSKEDYLRGYSVMIKGNSSLSDVDSRRFIERTASEVYDSVSGRLQHLLTPRKDR